MLADPVLRRWPVPTIFTSSPELWSAQFIIIGVIKIFHSIRHSIKVKCTVIVFLDSVHVIQIIKRSDDNKNEKHTRHFLESVTDRKTTYASAFGPCLSKRTSRILSSSPNACLMVFGPTEEGRNLICRVFDGARVACANMWTGKKLWDDNLAFNLLPNNKMRNLFVIPSSSLGRGNNVIVVWHPQSIYLAAAGSNSTVLIYHRSGTEVGSFTLPSFPVILIYYIKCHYYHHFFSHYLECVPSFVGIKTVNCL